MATGDKLSAVMRADLVAAAAQNSANPITSGAVFNALGRADASGLLAMVAAAPNASGFAPAGFGLGELRAPVIDHTTIDDFKRNGWAYYSDVSYPLVSGDNRTSACLIMAMGNPGITNGWHQIALCFTYPELETTVLVRNTNQPWEYVNPPMYDGVEYRTTERFQGKPVYCKTVSLGAVVAGTQSLATVVSAVYSTAAVMPVRTSGIGFYTVNNVSNRLTLHFTQNDGSPNAKAVTAANSTRVSVTNFSTLSFTQAYVTVYYVKEA